MRHDEKLSCLIGDIYDCALDSALWPDVLGKITRFTVGQSAALLSKDAASGTGDVHYHFGCLVHAARRAVFPAWPRWA